MRCTARKDTRLSGCEQGTVVADGGVALGQAPPAIFILFHLMVRFGSIVLQGFLSVTV